MGPLVSIALAWVGATAAAPRVFVGGEPALRGAVEAGVLHERPALEFTTTASAADLVFDVVGTSSAALSLHHGAEGRVLEVRPLGTRADVDAAVRLAVLIITERVDVYATSAPPPVTAPLEIIGPWTAAGAWRVAAGVSGGISAGARVGGAVAVGRRWSAWQVGARVFGRWCCTITGESLAGSALSVAGAIELRRSLWAGPVDLGLRVGAGLVHHAVEARAVDVFAGPSGPESTDVSGALGRIAASLELPVGGGWGVVFEAGVEAQSSAWSIRLPPPYDVGRAPLEGDFAFPFAELSLSFDILDPP